jgi:hypothetical protein
MIVGLVITVAAVIVGVTSAVIVGNSIGRPLYEVMSNPVRPTPVDETLTLRAGRYTVFELVADNEAPPITAEDVKVTGPDGKKVATSGFRSSSEEVTRGSTVYAGAVEFTVPAPGDYRVRVTNPGKTEVVIAPGLGSGFDTGMAWLLAGLASGIAFLIGVVLMIVGAVRRRRGRKPAAAAARNWNPTGPDKGWYPAPDSPGRQRYWDGQAWTEYLR